MTLNIAVSDSETAQTDSEGGDNSDKPPHGDESLHKSSKSDKNSPTLLPTPPAIPPAGDNPSMTHHNSHASQAIPLPPPESGTYEKQPGHTRRSLQELILSAAEHESSLHPKQESNSTSGSSASSPTVADSECWSPPSTRPPSQPASRAPSMSAGTSGGKVGPVSQTSATVTVTAASKGVPPSSPVLPTSEHVTVAPHKGKPGSVPSDGGGHKFTLKDLLASGPKVGRKSSQRSAGSSKKSDSDGGDRKSTAGDSAVSLTQKYGVCQKVAIGKGATSVVRLAHKWDRSEEKLYAVKVKKAFCVSARILLSMTLSDRNSERDGGTKQKKNISRN